MHADDLIPGTLHIIVAVDSVVAVFAVVTVVAAVVAAAPDAKIAAVTPPESQGELAVQVHEDDGLAVPDAPSTEISGGAERAEAQRRFEDGHDASAPADLPKLTLAAVAVRVKLDRIEFAAVVAGGDFQALVQVCVGQDEDDVHGAQLERASMSVLHWAQA